MHKLVAEAFLIKNKSLINPVVDHKNENKLDNNLNNLQYLSFRDNILKGIKSKSHGIVYNKRHKKYNVQIYFGSALHLGSFSTKEKALEVYLKAKEDVDNGIKLTVNTPYSKKVKGFYKRGNRFIAVKTIKRKNHYIGSFSTEEEASEAFLNFKI